MAILFYPHEDDLQRPSLVEKLEVLLEAAERFKAAILEIPVVTTKTEDNKKRAVPRDIALAYNWGEISKILREIREMPEGNSASKASKAMHLTKLADVYEVLRGAKMPKLEAVRLALMNEANQLRAGSSQVA